MLKKVFIAIGFLFCANLAHAALILGGYPAPGGNSVSASGISPGHAGGKTFTLSGFNPAAYSSLYYGVDPMYLPAIGENSPQGMTFNMGASNLAGGVATWTNQFSVFNSANSTSQIVNGSFTYTFTDTSNAALALVSAASLGLPTQQGAYLNVLGDFNVNLQFSINNTAALQWYDNFSNLNGNSIATSVGGAFYYEEATTVPEPGTFALFTLALLGLGIAKRRNAVNIS